MDQAVTQWINSFAGTNALLDSAMIVATKAGALFLVPLVVVQFGAPLQALVHKGVLSCEDALGIVDRSLEAAANAPSAKEAGEVAEITQGGHEGVREGLAAKGSEHPSGPTIDTPGTGRSKAFRLGELIGRRVGRAMRDSQKPDD